MSLEVLSTLLILGCFTGFVSGLLGVGGGLILVPVLSFIFESQGMAPPDAMILAVGTSLLTIFFTTLSGARSHWQLGRINLNEVKRWLPWIGCGVAIGTYLVRFFGGVLSMSVFVIVALVIAFRLVTRRTASKYIKIPTMLHNGLVIMIGAGSTLMGIVPYMVSRGGDTHRAIAHASAIGVFLSLIGTIAALLLIPKSLGSPQGTFGGVNLYLGVLVVMTSVLFAPLGVKAGRHFSSRLLQLIFATFLLASAGKVSFSLMSMLVFD